MDLPTDSTTENASLIPDQRTCMECLGLVRATRPDAKFCSMRCYTRYRKAHHLTHNYLPDSVFWERVQKTEGGCWNYTGPTSGQQGYGAWRQDYAHRYSWELYNDRITDNLFVLHRCDNPRCVNPDHLFLGTHEDNMNDMRRKGRGSSGNRNGARLHPERMQVGTDRHNAKLNPEKVRAIRALFSAGGTTQAALARQFGVNHVTLLRVIQGQTWKHVT